MKPRVYLCGPINGCTDEECNGWRALARDLFGDDAYLVDPMRRDYRGREDLAYRELVELDKVDVGLCDVVLASCPKPSVGTSMEVLWAWERGKMVVAVVPLCDVVSPWLRYHSTFLARTYGEAVQFILEFYTSLDPRGSWLGRDLPPLGRDLPPRAREPRYDREGA